MRYKTRPHSLGFDARAVVTGYITHTDMMRHEIVQAYAKYEQDMKS